MLRCSDFLSLGLNICTILMVSSHNESHRENFRNLKIIQLCRRHGRLYWISYPYGDYQIAMGRQRGSLLDKSSSWKLANSHEKATTVFARQVIHMKINK